MMQSYRIFYVSALLAVTLAYQATPALSQSVASLTVKVSGLRNYKGKVIFYVWANTQETGKFPDVSKVQFRDERSNSEACDFPKYSVCRRTVESLQDLTVSFTFRDLTIGEYAVFVVHDENNNGVADTGLFRRPLEARGYSQILPDDINPVAERVSFQRARFDLNDTRSITIGLRYPPRL